jgi:hypothetical protein
MPDEELEKIIIRVLDSMFSQGPEKLERELRRKIEDYLDDHGGGGDPQTDRCWDLLLSPDPNQQARLRFGEMLRTWDNAVAGNWIGETKRNSSARRSLIYDRLDLPQGIRNRVDNEIPFPRIEEPVVVSDETEEWYNSEQHGPRSPRTFYWRTYSRYLRDVKNWNEDSILSLDNATREIVARLGNPEDTAKSFAARGLVMGYVQSGKTSNFTGVIAKAIDAGYRLIIVLAGTWNMLRTQTQRRIDKELIGREQLSNTDDYSIPPVDWNFFVSHGGTPSATSLGPDCHRLTGLDDDYRGLGDAGIKALAFSKDKNELPFNHPDNLHRSPARLIVVKKLPAVLRKLNEDLRKLGGSLVNVPALIIDDESDQAGLNTRKPKKNLTIAERRERKDITATNRQIRRLLRLLPRGQYVGYTATPFANFFVNTEDVMDLFPRHFILSMEKPAGYMGIDDFFDTEIPSDEVPDDFRHKERAYLRKAHEWDDPDFDESLKKAVGAFILSGAIKLYREQHADPLPDSNRRPHFAHHTMLVHTSHRKDAQETDRVKVMEIFDWLTAMRSYMYELWRDDFLPVMQAQNIYEGLAGYIPQSVDQLVPFIDSAVAKIEHGVKVRVLNSSEQSDPAPDFDREDIWGIIVGGNKLSRGYTIEGLTVSYYSRKAGAGDTLMQMGRWFGFRPGYRDLVRVFVARDVGPRSINLVDLFKQACRLEERARSEIKQYARSNGDKPLRPIDVPPLIAVAGSLLPTSRAKMWNAEIVSTNYGDRWFMPTRMPTRREQKDRNLELAAQLWEQAIVIGGISLGGRYAVDGTRLWPAKLRETTVESFLHFLSSFEWLSGPPKKDWHPQSELELAKRFLSESDHPHRIASCLIIAPQLVTPRQDGLGPWNGLSVKRRKRTFSGAFQGFGEPLHRSVADYLTGRTNRLAEKPAIYLEDANSETAALRDEHRMVVLLYPVQPAGESEVTIGFEILFPANDGPQGASFRTKKSDPNAGPVVPVPAAQQTGIVAADAITSIRPPIRLRYSKTMFSAGASQHEAARGFVAEIPPDWSGRAVDVKCYKWIRPGDGSPEQLHPCENLDRSAKRRIGSLVARLVADPDGSLRELQETAVSLEPGMGNEVNVLLRSGGDGQNVAQALLDWTGDAMVISGDFLGEIDALMTIEENDP